MANATFDLNGIDEVIKNLKNFVPRLKAALALDAENIAANMEAWAKNNAPWTDQTGDARDFIKQTVKWTNADILMVSLSHNVNYGIYLELCNEGKYAILEKAIAEFGPKFMEGWQDVFKKLGF